MRVKYQSLPELAACRRGGYAEKEGKRGHSIIILISLSFSLYISIYIYIYIYMYVYIYIYIYIHIRRNPRAPRDPCRGRRQGRIHAPNSRVRVDRLWKCGGWMAQRHTQIGRTCHILPPSEIDWGLLWAVFTGPKRECISQTWLKGYNMATMSIPACVVAGCCTEQRQNMH